MAPMTEPERMREAVEAAAKALYTEREGGQGNPYYPHGVPWEERDDKRPWLGEAECVIEAALPFFGGLGPTQSCEFAKCDGGDSESWVLCGICDRPVCDFHGYREPDGDEDWLCPDCRPDESNPSGGLPPKPNGLDLSDGEIRQVLVGRHAVHCVRWAPSSGCDCGFVSGLAKLRAELARRVDACPSGVRHRR